MAFRGNGVGSACKGRIGTPFTPCLQMCQKIEGIHPWIVQGEIMWLLCVRGSSHRQDHVHPKTAVPFHLCHRGTVCASHKL